MFGGYDNKKKNPNQHRVTLCSLCCKFTSTVPLNPHLSYGFHKSWSVSLAKEDTLPWTRRCNKLQVVLLSEFVSAFDYNMGRCKPLGLTKFIPLSYLGPSPVFLFLRLDLHHCTPFGEPPFTFRGLQRLMATPCMFIDTGQT